MSATVEKVPTTDDEWRESHFSELQIATARVMGRIPYKDLVAHLERFGPDGILESAVMLTRSEYERLEKLVKAKEPTRTVRRRRRG